MDRVEQNVSGAALRALGGIVQDATPAKLMAWIYAVLYSSSYRARYSDFLKRDFPRVPLPTNATVFDALAHAGEELITLHTMQRTLSRITTFDVAGSNAVENVRWAEVGDGNGRIYINAEQYFGRVPEAVWDTHIGGYRIAEKWLKDRKGRRLSYNDLEHYQAVLAALARTLELQAEIDEEITKAGGWPLRAQH